MTEQAVGEQLDALGVTLELGENQHIQDVLIIVRLGDAEDGQTALATGASTGCDWITRLGLMAGARAMVEHSITEVD